jgi:hypothetical protein
MLVVETTPKTYHIHQKTFVFKLYFQAVQTVSINLTFNPLEPQRVLASCAEKRLSLVPLVDVVAKSVLYVSSDECVTLGGQKVIRDDFRGC